MTPATAATPEARVQAAYGRQVYARLCDVKTKLDPDNLFHGAQNVPPRSRSL